MNPFLKNYFRVVTLHCKAIDWLHWTSNQYCIAWIVCDWRKLKPAWLHDEAVTPMSICFTLILIVHFFSEIKRFSNDSRSFFKRFELRSRLQLLLFVSVCSQCRASKHLPKKANKSTWPVAEFDAQKMTIENRLFLLKKLDSENFFEKKLLLPGRDNKRKWDCMSLKIQSYCKTEIISYWNMRKDVFTVRDLFADILLTSS